MIMSKLMIFLYVWNSKHDSQLWMDAVLWKARIRPIIEPMVEIIQTQFGFVETINHTLGNQLIKALHHNI